MWCIHSLHECFIYFIEISKKILRSRNWLKTWRLEFKQTWVNHIILKFRNIFRNKRSHIIWNCDPLTSSSSILLFLLCSNNWLLFLPLFLLLITIICICICISHLIFITINKCRLRLKWRIFLIKGLWFY